MSRTMVIKAETVITSKVIIAHRKGKNPEGYSTALITIPSHVAKSYKLQGGELLTWGIVKVERQ